jgi:hypothetical protein
VAARRFEPTVATVVLAAMVVVGFVIGSDELRDNSFLTHLATGRMFWSGAGFPHEDPYTFTAAGEPWVVQSWLPSLVYAGIEEVTSSLVGVRLLLGLTTAAIAALLWHLSAAAGSLTARLLLVLPALLVGIDGWSERPLLVGLLALGTLLLALDGRIRPGWLLPLMWVWVNSHGSWPLGIAVVLAALAGRRLDGEPVDRPLRCLGWLVAGAAVSVANPYGIEILTFPVELLGRRESLAEIEEWQRPAFGDAETVAVLFLALLVGWGLVRRFRWEALLPASMFLLAALVAVRNQVSASLVLVAAAAPGLQGIGSISSTTRRPSHRLAVLAVSTLGLVAAVAVARGPAFDDRLYPVEADQYLRAHGLDPRTHRVVAREAVGNWLEARYGPTGNVYVDDRVEVIPGDVIGDHQRLLGGSADWEEILVRTGAEALLWQVEEELAPLVAADDDWEVVYEDERWFVAVPVS